MTLHFLISGEFGALTGGYIYNSRIINGLELLGCDVRLHGIPGDFPFPSEQSLMLCQQVTKVIPKGEIIIIDSLVFGAIPDILEEIKNNHPIVALIHTPLSVTDYAESNHNSICEFEKKSLAYADLLVVTGPLTKKILNGMGIDPGLIQVIIPGVEVITPKHSYAISACQFLCVSNYTRNKGHMLLLDAFHFLKNFEWRLDCYGTTEFDVDYYLELKERIGKYGLQEKVVLHSAITGLELSSAYASADILIHPSPFETYGMVLAEALAHGLPVITTLDVAKTQTVPPSMGLFFETNDTSALQQAILKILNDNHTYHRLCSGIALFSGQNRTWDMAVAEFFNCLTAIS